MEIFANFGGSRPIYSPLGRHFRLSGAYGGVKKWSNFRKFRVPENAIFCDFSGPPEKSIFSHFSRFFHFSRFPFYYRRNAVFCLPDRVGTGGSRGGPGAPGAPRAPPRAPPGAGPGEAPPGPVWGLRRARNGQKFDFFVIFGGLGGKKSHFRGGLGQYYGFI